MTQGWSIGTLGWVAVVVWLCANILSQAAFMGTYGEPFTADLLLEQLGRWWWAAVALELSVYAFLGWQGVRAMKRRVARRLAELEGVRPGAA